MMLNETPGYGAGIKTSGRALAGNNRDPNSLRTYKQIGTGSLFLTLLVGLAIGYFLTKRSRRG